MAHRELRFRLRDAHGKCAYITFAGPDGSPLNEWPSTEYTLEHRKTFAERWLTRPWRPWRRWCDGSPPGLWWTIGQWDSPPVAHTRNADSPAAEDEDVRLLRAATRHQCRECDGLGYVTSGGGRHRFGCSWCGGSGRMHPEALAALDRLIADRARLRTLVERQKAMIEDLDRPLFSLSDAKAKGR